MYNAKQIREMDERIRGKRPLYKSPKPTPPARSTGQPVTLLQEHCRRWQGGCGTEFCAKVRNKVFYRGKVPCDVLFVGEAPGYCLAGDTLIDTAFRNKKEYPKGIPIKDLVGKSGFKVYSYDLDRQKLVLGTVRKVWKTGVKTVYRVRYYWWGGKPDGSGGRHKYYGEITVTNSHPFLLRNGEYRSILGGLTKGNRLQPFFRRGYEYHLVGTSSGSLKQESLFLMENKLGRSLEGDEQVHHQDRNKWNDQEDNLILTDIASHARIHGYEDNVMFKQEHRDTHRRAMARSDYREGQSRRMRAHLADPSNYARRVEQIRSKSKQTSSTLKKKFASDPVYYYRYLKSMRWNNGRMLTEEEIKQKMAKRFPSEDYPPSEDNHTVLSIEKIGPRPVYDMEVDEFHNFAANGIFVHNCEDQKGLPFWGPAGLLMDDIIARSLGVMEPVPRHALTNLVCCIPRVEGEKLGEPYPEQIDACAPRLVEFVELCKPKLIVCVGNLARDFLDPKYANNIPVPREIPQVAVMHPAAILRGPAAMKGVWLQNAVAAILTAAGEVLG